MKRLSLVAVALVVGIVISSGVCSAADGLKQISGSGITVSYPEGMDTQAKRVMAIAQSIIKPSIEVHRQTVALLSDIDGMSKDMTTMLGADEKQDLAKNRLKSFKDKSAALVAAFSNIKLIRKSSAIAADGLDAGVIRLRYTKNNDAFNMVVEEQDVSPEKLKRSFFPVIVNADGTIRGEAKVGQLALDFLGAGDPMAIAPVQDTVSYLIAEPLKIYHPLTRWFSEGVSGYVTKQMVAKYAPKLNSLANALFSVSPKSRELRAKVNLPAWPQSAYVNRDPGAFDPELEAAQTQFAIEAVSGIVAKAGPQALPKIMNIVNYSGNPDTNAICAAIQKVTGTDFKPTLMSYIPQEARDGLASGEAPKLITKAQDLIGKKKWTEAAAVLREVLAMTPEDANVRLNLAWVIREFGQRRDAELQLFMMAGLLRQQKYSFSLYAPTVEGNYVVGRLAIMMGNLEFAKQSLQTVLKYKPDHADAKRAMEEVDKLEKAARGGGG